MKIKIIKFILLSLFITLNSLAQRVTKSKSDENTIVFDTDESQNNLVKTPQYNQIKVGVLSFFSGYVPVYYERQLFPWLGVQAGVGITFKNFLYDLLPFSDAGLFDEDSQESPNFAPGTDVDDNYQDYKIRNYNMGPAFTISPKIFPSGDDCEGFYIAPEYYFRRWNYEVQNIVPNSFALIRDKTSFDKEFRRLNIMTMNFGVQTFFDNLVLDTHLGIGVAGYKMSRQDIGMSGDYNSPFTPVYLQKQLVTSRTGFYFNYEIKLGYFF